MSSSSEIVDEPLPAVDTGRLSDTMIASAISGMIARIPLHPIDTCKAKMQVSSSTAGTYSSVLDCMVQTYKQSGIRGLYSGFGITFFGSAPALCLYFTSYEYIKTLISRVRIINNHTPQFLQHFTAGMLAECVSCVLWVPIDVVKERLQTQSNLVQTAKVKNMQVTQYTGNLNAIVQISRQEGLRGIYKGYGATVASFGPFSALYLSGMYNKLVKCTLNRLLIPTHCIRFSNVLH